jgi:riboflavin kinase/FMN adenylyltransferase
VRLLGQPYELTGRVVTGGSAWAFVGDADGESGDGVDGRASRRGVYAGRVEIGGRDYAAAVHIGPNPTFEEGESKIEVHVLDFSGDLYGSALSVTFFERLRGLEKFPDKDALVAQIGRDVKNARGTA